MVREEVTRPQSPYREPIATTTSAIVVVETPKPPAAVRVGSVCSTAIVSLVLHVVVTGAAFWIARDSRGDSLLAMVFGSLHAARATPWLSLTIFAGWLVLAFRAHRREAGEGSVRARAIEGALVMAALALVERVPWSDPIAAELCAVAVIVLLIAALLFRSARKNTSVFAE